MSATSYLWSVSFTHSSFNTNRIVVSIVCMNCLPILSTITSFHCPQVSTNRMQLSNSRPTPLKHARLSSCLSFFCFLTGKFSCKFDGHCCSSLAEMSTHFKVLHKETVEELMNLLAHGTFNAHAFRTHRHPLLHVCCYGRRRCRHGGVSLWQCSYEIVICWCYLSTYNVPSDHCRSHWFPECPSTTDQSRCQEVDCGKRSAITRNDTFVIIFFFLIARPLIYT
jgi:hypothetical protein